MAAIAAAGIMAAGSIAGGLLGGKGGKGGGGGGRLSPIDNFVTNTPLYGSNLDLTSGVKSLNFYRQGSAWSDINAGRGRVMTGLEDLRGMLKPGFGAFTDAVVKAVNNARDKAVGSLNDALTRRRVAGSSFAEGLKSSVMLDFGQQEAQLRSGAFLQELSANLDILNQEWSNIGQLVQEGLAEAQIAAGMSAPITAGIQSANALSAQLAMANAQGTGQFIGSATGSVADLVKAIIEGNSSGRAPNVANVMALSNFNSPGVAIAPGG